MPLYSTSPAAPVDPAKQALARFLNKRIVVRAEFSCYGSMPQVGRRFFAVQQVYHNGLLVADHIWMSCSFAVANLHLRRGEPLQLEGRVIRYIKKNHPTLFYYGLDNVNNILCLSRKRDSHD